MAQAQIKTATLSRYSILLFATATALLLLGTFLITARATAATPKAKYGYLVIYSEKGRYDQVKVHADEAISIENPNPETDPKIIHRCGGTFPTSGASTRDIIKKLPTKIVSNLVTPRKLKCAAVGGGAASYRIYYGKKNTTDPFPVSAVTGIDIDEKRCTYVYPDGTVTNPSQEPNVDVTSAAGCTNAPRGDTPTPISVNVTLDHPAGTSTYLSNNKKYVTGRVYIKSGSESLTKNQCSGLTVTADYTNAGATQSTSRTAKYVRPSGSEKGYCTAKFSSKTLTLSATSAKTYDVKAKISATAYLNAAESDSTSMTIPARKR